MIIERRIKPRLFLHIGTEKTGTTTIQEFLYLNSNKLYEHGFYVVQTGGNKNHRFLVANSMNDSKYDDFFMAKGIDNLVDRKRLLEKFRDEFNEEMSSLPKNIHTVIVSSEHFHSRLNSKEEVAKFHEFISPYFSDIKICCYIREQYAMASSWYSTIIKSGGVLSFNEHLESCKPENIYYNHFNMISLWEDQFSRASVNLRLFDRESFLNRNLLDDFTAQLSEELVDKVNKVIKLENESIDRMGQLIGRAINSVFSVFEPGGGSNRLRNRCFTILSELSAGSGEQVSPEKQRQIFESFENSNDALRERYFSEIETLFKFNIKAVDNSSIDEDKLILLLSTILEDLDKEYRGRLLTENNANLLRDAALQLESQDLKMSYNIMKLAKICRPKGDVINQKLREYSNNIESR